MRQVLVIDDEMIARRMLMESICWEEHGYRICAEAANGRDGLEKTVQYHPDLIFVDIKMPVMDGLEFLRQLHGLGIRTKVVMLTCYNEFEYAREAMRLGAVDYLIKHTFEPEELETLLKKLSIQLAAEDLHNLGMELLGEDALSRIVRSDLTDDGVFVGIPNTAAPGGLYYRRDLAREYLGTDDPDEVSALLGDWDKYVEIEQKVKEQSGGTVSLIPGIDSFVQPLVNQTGLRWREDDKLMVSENFTGVLEVMKKLADADIDAGLDIWSAAYNASFAQGSVIAYPGSCWFQSYVLEPNDPDGAGNWGVAVLPGEAYNWGGIWWGMYNQSENKEAVAAWMKYELTKQGARNKYDLIHFYPGVKSVYEDDYLNAPNDFFAGQNVTELYLKEMKEMTVLRPIADDALFYNSMTFFAESMNGTAEEIADQIEDDIISSNPQYSK